MFGKLGIGILNALSHLPLSVHYFFSDVLLYPLVRYVVRYRVKVVRKNLLKAFPDKTEKERNEIMRKFYHYFCDLAVEIIKVHSISAEEIRRRFEYVGIDKLDEAYATHDFVCCYLSHYCNWEWCVGLPLSLEGHGAGMCQIYHPMKNKLFDQWFLDNRSRFGTVNIPMKQTVRRLMTLRNEMKQEGSPYRSYMFGCIADQLPKAENIHHRIPFLNQDTAVFTGSDMLCRFKARVLDSHQSEGINGVVRDCMEDDAIVFSDKSTSYVDISDLVELHVTEKSDAKTTKETLKWVHIAISNAKRTLLGNYHKIKRKYLQLYLNEFIYKLNRRYFGDKLFDRLVIANITGA